MARRKARMVVEAGAVRRAIEDFGRVSTMPGVNHVVGAKSQRDKWLWTIFFFICVAVLAVQITKTLLKFFKYDKIVQMELKFETGEFPSVTLCNLNPYKKSLLTNVESAQQTLAVVAAVMKRAPGRTKRDNTEAQRLKRKVDDRHYFPKEMPCACGSTNENLKEACVPVLGNEYIHPRLISSTCLCWNDARFDPSYHPCYPKYSWKRENCTGCSDSGYCSKTPLEVLQRDWDGGVDLCLCNPDFNLCIKDDPSLNTTLDALPPPLEQDTLQNMGYLDENGQAMTDEVAIAAKGKENLVFAMAELETEHLETLSYTKQDLITKCSFNGKQCDLENDFKVHVDPMFGNCYTFNHNRSQLFTSNRAGPTHGLRVLMYSNVSDYLPLTEEVGVRVAIHEKTQMPFPDTVGYSAPVGTMSSFGIRMGCYRSCYQHKVAVTCGCCDPRFPSIPNYHYCGDRDSRLCLERARDSGINLLRSCNCPLPCREDSYVVSFSASKWPSGVAQVSNCRIGDKRCLRNLLNNAAMVQVYFEQLSYEMHTESEAYGVENVLADFGGHLGLWMGVSIISIVEVFVLLYNLFFIWRLEREQAQLIRGSYAPNLPLPCVCDCDMTKDRPFAWRRRKPSPAAPFTYWSKYPEPTNGGHI